MRARKKLILAGVCVAVAAGAFWATRNTEPTYEGHKLSELVYSYSPYFSGDEAGRKRAGEAIAHLGTNAVPYFLDWIQYREPRWRQRLRIAIENRFHKSIGAERAMRANLAAEAFRALGPAADDAMAKLTSLANATNIIDSTFLAVTALANSGRPKAVPPLLAALTNQNTVLRSVAASMMGLMGKTAQPAVPALITCLKDSDEDVVRGAIWSLREIKQEPETVVPALVDALNDPRPFVQRSATMALRVYGAQARSAIPALLRALRDNNAEVRWRATNTIRAIEPDLLPVK